MVNNLLVDHYFYTDYLVNYTHMRMIFSQPDGPTEKPIHECGCIQRYVIA